MRTPARASANVLPIVGCPAIGSSSPGVKIRIRTSVSACSGGKTESIANVFGSSIPYLVGVPDPYDYYCPLHTWTLNFSGPEISAKLGGYLDGKLKQVVITKHGVSPRIVAAKLIGTGGVTTVSGEQLEVALGAYSTWMSFQKVSG